jgi:hypothetical protein
MVPRLARHDVAVRQLAPESQRIRPPAIGMERWELVSRLRDALA